MSISAPAGAARPGQYLRPLTQITTRICSLRVGNCYFIATPGGLCRVLSGAKIPTTGASAPALRPVVLRDWASLVCHFAPSLFLKAPRLSEAMCRRKECRGACGGSLNGGDRSGEAQLRELGHTCPDERSRAAAVSGNRSLIYICGSVCLYRFS